MVESLKYTKAILALFCELVRMDVAFTLNYKING
jgi:hypothetical protein